MERECSFADAIFASIDHVLGRIPDSLVIGGAWGGVLRDRDPAWSSLVERYSERIIYPPIAELASCGIAVGAAMAGSRPLVNLGMASYAYQSWPQLVNEAPNIHYMTGGAVRVPLVVHFFAGGRPGSAAQHTHHPEASLLGVPGLEVVVPATPADAAGLFLSAVESDNPTVFVSHLGLLDERGPVPEHPFRVPIGRARVARVGSEVTVVASSIMVPRAMEAADLLSREGIDVEVVDLRSLSPLDRSTICESVAKTGRLVVAEEGQLTAGVGAEIAAIVAEECFGMLHRPIRRVAVPDCPIPASPVLKALLEPGTAQVMDAVRSTTGGSSMGGSSS